MTHAIVHADLLGYLRGNRWLHVDRGADLAFNPFWSSAYVGFPEPQNGIAALGEVGVLRLVNVDAPVLALGKYGEFVGVSVPVIPVELNDDLVFGDECIHAELPTDHYLRFEVNADAIEDRVSRAFNAVDLARLLFSVHSAQHNRSFRVFVSAFKRTVDRIGLRAGWRPTERLAAHFAGVLVFVASLPRDLMLNAAEVVIGIFETNTGKVKHVAAKLTRDITPVHTLTPTALKSAFTRTVAMLAVDRFSTRWAGVIAGANTDVHARFTAILPAALIFSRRAGVVCERLAADNAPAFLGTFAASGGAFSPAVLRGGRKTRSDRFPAMLACDGAHSVGHMNARSILSTLCIIPRWLHNCYYQQPAPIVVVEDKPAQLGLFDEEVAS